MQRKKYAVYGLVIILVLFVIGLNIPFATHEVYVATENITINEPYNEAAANKKDTLRKVVVAADYYADNAHCINYIYKPPSNCGLVIENADAVNGEFKVEFNIATQKKKEFTKVFNVFIPAGKKKKISFTVNDKITRFTFYITPPSKEGYEYLNLQDPRTVTNCHDVQEMDKMVRYCTLKKIRKFTKIKETKKSLLLRLIQ